MRINLSVSLGNNRASFTWEHLFQSHYGKIVPVSLEKYFNWKQLYQCYFGAIAGVSLGKNCTSIIRINIVSLPWELSRQYPSGTTASFTSEQSCQFNLKANLNYFKFRLTKKIRQTSLPIFCLQISLDIRTSTGNLHWYNK